MATLTASIRCRLLIAGYMRIEYRKHQNYDQFETSLVNIIIQLLGSIFMIFDVYPMEAGSMFSDDGLTFKNNKEFRKLTFGCSYGWKKGVHKISVKNKYKWIRGVSQAIGITNRIQIFTTKAAWYGHFDRYIDEYRYNLNSPHLVGTDIPSRNFVFESNKGGGVITMLFDGDNGTITFYYNDKIIGESINIKKDEIYYPFISYYGEPNAEAEFHLINGLE